MITTTKTNNEKQIAIVLENTTTEELCSMRDALINVLSIADATEEERYFVHMLLRSMMPTHNQIIL